MYKLQGLENALQVGAMSVDKNRGDLVYLDAEGKYTDTTPATDGIAFPLVNDFKKGVDSIATAQLTGVASIKSGAATLVPGDRVGVTAGALLKVTSGASIGIVLTPVTAIGQMVSVLLNYEK